MSPHPFTATNNFGYTVLERTIYGITSSMTQSKEKKKFWEELIQCPCSVIKSGWGSLHAEFYKLITVQLGVINSPEAKVSGSRLGASARGNNSWNSENILSFSLAVDNCWASCNLT